MAKMSTTIADSPADSPLMNTWRRHLPDDLSSSQCFTMPSPAMVNPVNTPMAYSATRADRLAPVAMIRARATTVRTMIPLENARRWPRRVSCLGRYESEAT